MTLAENILSDVFCDGAIDLWNIETLNNEDFFLGHHCWRLTDVTGYAEQMSGFIVDQKKSVLS